jgi:hypothetical protein
MANLGKKGDVCCVRFRLRGKEYKKSLRTKDESAARGALHLVELTLHRLYTGQLHVPDRVDPGDFVVSGGTLLERVERTPPAEPAPPLPSTRELVSRYTTALKTLVAPSYLASQALHLRHLLRHLGDRADDPVLRQLPARPAEGVAGEQLAGDRGVEPSVGQRRHQVGVADGGARTGPGDDLAQ